MSALTERIAADLGASNEDPILVQVIFQNEHFTKELFSRLPDEYCSRCPGGLGEAIRESLDTLAPHEVTVLLEHGSAEFLSLEAGGKKHRIWVEDWKVRRVQVATSAFAELSEMQPEDFVSVLDLDQRDLSVVLELFGEYLKAGDSLGYRAGSFFDWCCALASLANYKAAQLKESGGELLELLRTVRQLAQENALGRTEVETLVRGVAEFHSHRGVRALRIELLRAIRTGDLALAKTFARSTWTGARGHRASVRTRRYRKTPPGQKEH
jgi:hypothetical protein